MVLAAGMMVATAQPKASHCGGCGGEACGDAIEKAVKETLAKMTIHEKVQLLHAQSKFTSAGVPRLGIPELSMSDGPHGCRAEIEWNSWNYANWTNDSITAFPSLTCLASTWNRELSFLYGDKVSQEFAYRKKDVMLGPGTTIARCPFNGRSFEYMGEDPYLAGEMAVPYIIAAQKNGVACCLKHFFLNNHEVNRMTVNVNVSERAVEEIYLPAFEKCVKEAKVWSMMGSYNKWLNRHCCQNDSLLNGILKKRWGFDGAVISDWGGCHDTDEAITNGLDLEFGTWTDGLTMGATNGYDAYHLAHAYLERLRDGRASEEVLNDKVRRVLRLNFRTAMRSDKPYGSLCSPEHYEAARRIGGEGIVLLKNEGGLLPVKADAKKILVVGENAIKMMTVGGGSSSLKVQREVSPLDGIRAAAPAGVQVVYERGYVGDVSGSYNGVVTGQDLSESRSSAQLIADACSQAADADVVIFVGGLNKAAHQDCEDSDRYGLELPYGQDAVIKALAAVNPSLAVVIVSGNAVAMPWVEDVNAIVEAWYGGSEAGNAIADVLFGKVNPSGKLPFTFPIRLEDNGAHALGAYDPKATEAHYSEGIFVGYRWAQKHGIKPLFAFGHGLSYTAFEYSNPKAKRSVMRADGTLKMSVTVTNTGELAGKEVVQLYIKDVEASLERPEMELKAFRKIALEPGESKVVEFVVTPDMLKFYDPAKGDWVLEPGRFVACIGASSEDIRHRIGFEVK